ncbi:MAG: hypothetical protein ACRD3W_11200, partial [Terriglobales bacterium]
MMFGPDFLQYLYWTCAGSGMAFCFFAAFMSGHHGGQGHGHSGHGHAGHGFGHGHHGIGHGHGTAAGHGSAAGARVAPGHGTAAGHGSAAGARVPPGHGTGGTGHGNAGGHSSASGGANNAEPVAMPQGTTQALTGPMHPPHELRHISIVEILLTVFNPMRIASFLACFGLVGRATEMLFPWLGFFT